MTQKLQSIQLERHFLGGLIKHPETYFDVSTYIKEEDFTEQVHRTMFLVASRILNAGEKLDKIILAQKINDLKIQFAGQINIYDYVDNVSFTQITKDATLKSAKELVKLRIKRDLVNSAEEEKNFVFNSGDKDINDIINGVDAIHNEKINQFTNDDNPSDLFEGIMELAYDRAKNPDQDCGLITPYPDFNRFFGGIRAGNGIYAIVSRPKQGKSSWLLEMAKGIAQLNPGCKVLYLDTEMQKDVNQFRIMSAFSKVPMWFLESGNWAKNVELADKLKKVAPDMESLKGKVYHKNVANKPIEQVCSIIRRWYFSQVGRGNKCLVIYDYLKLTGEKISNNWAEHQAIGEKINLMNEVGGQLKIPIWTSMQMNRSAEDGRDDSAAVAISDRLQWFCAFNGIFRRRSLEELQRDGESFGSHKMIPLATRFQGKDGYGHNDSVRIDEGNGNVRYEKFYINYHVDNFSVAERGNINNVVAARAFQALPNELNAARTQARTNRTTGNRTDF